VRYQTFYITLQIINLCISVSLLTDTRNQAIARIADRTASQQTI